MEQAMYDALKKVENSWWYQGRIFALQAILHRYSIPSGSVLDLGAGFGGMHPLLAAYGPVTAFEIERSCLDACYARGYQAVLSKEVEMLNPPYPYTFVGAFDVIEHIEDDLGFLCKLRVVMSEGSYLVATVPAHQFLWSQFDIDAHHFRRYSKKTISSLLQKSGFELLYIGYWNSMLFFPAAVLRLFGYAGKEGLTPGAAINRFFTGIVRLESKIIPLFSLPFGLSLVIVARKSA